MTPVVMVNLKCLFDHVSAHASVDFIDACETLRKELVKSIKIAKKFKEKLILANLEKEELVVRLDNVRDHAPGPLFMNVGLNPREWMESCCCLSKWRFD